MDPDFSERQLEFAVNHELTLGLNAYMVEPLPLIPTTREEAELGYDALFDLGSAYLYFIQYKVASFGSRKTSWNEHYWATHGGPYFRVGLHADSQNTCRQHLLLEALRRREPGVYYCAPYFHTSDEFWDARRERRRLFKLGVDRRSRRPAPDALGATCDQLRPIRVGCCLVTARRRPTRRSVA
jgi:hypothetical protein